MKFRSSEVYGGRPLCLDVEAIRTPDIRSAFLGRYTMAIIQPKIVVPDDIFEKYISGETEIKGLAIDANNKRVEKHLDLVIDSYVDSQEEDNQVANSDTAGIALLVGLCATAIVGVVLGGAWIYKKLSNRKLNEFKKRLKEYVEAVNGQCLTTEHINALLKALDAIKGKKQEKIKIEFSGSEIIDLVECLCNHTRNLAEANDIEYREEYSEEEQNDVLLKLRKNLERQRDILTKAA